MTYSVYTHKVNINNNNIFYVGVTKDIKNRWDKSKYKSTALEPYINEYGWDNIEHNVVYETQDKEEAYSVEDRLICLYKSNGQCINQQRSGFITKNRKEYDNDKHKEYYHKRVENDKEWVEKEKNRLKKYKSERRANDEEWAEHQRELDRKRDRKRYLKPERKLYNRIQLFNRRNPDRIIETPLEAKQKYLQYGYIPDYVKNDDL